ncbi:protein IMPACT-like [Pollicipes pollicipes]|uniref:protein IMPACT-like n=1 Tax=Pollicipes pollicipes TaxID=41117 RepID=UPI001885697B|nr:protein IMPACT-like [Pollicipes pollicipes]
MWAYRIGGATSGAFQQDCDDDGETHAGARMLHLLEILAVRDVVVVVSRWFGGILLGPDRFRHINNATRGVLLLSGVLRPPEDKKKH